MKKRLLAGLLGVLMLLTVVMPAVLAENLRYGSEGSQVTQAQVRLSELGYYKGKVDGKFGYTTYTAVKAFQGKNSLKVDGVLGEHTNFILFKAGAKAADDTAATAPLYQRIAYGSEGPAVKTVQIQLRTLGYSVTDADSKFGWSTYKAVLAFQAAKSLTVDGVVGPATWAALTAGMSVPLLPPPPPPKPFDPATDKIPYNSSGAHVTQVQNKLKALGYYAGTVDGAFGYNTHLAVRDFQKTNGLKVDGIVGPKTWAKLFDASAKPKGWTPPPPPGVLRIKYGDVTAEVTQMQTKLVALNYLGVADGVFGWTTYEAVRSFQRVNGLKVDGVCGQKTWDKLHDASAKPKP